MNAIKRVLKTVVHFIYKYWYSLLMCLVSLWLGLTLVKVGHVLLANVMIILVVLKLLGMLLNIDRLRVTGIVGLNMMWAIFTYYFFTGQHPPVELTYQFPAVILMIGVGISLRGRFNG